MGRAVQGVGEPGEVVSTQRPSLSEVKGSPHYPLLVTGSARAPGQVGKQVGFCFVQGIHMFVLLIEHKSL